MDKEYWDLFYADRSGRPDPSSFALEVNRLFPEKGTLLELGCGDGRDAIYFASQGWNVIATDLSANGILEARKSITDGLEFISVDVAELEFRDLLDSVISSPQLSPPLVYSRFFLHSLDDREFNSLVLALNHPQVGFNQAHEFRVRGDENLPKTFGGHRRVFRELSAVKQSLIGTSSRDVMLEVEGTGLAPYGEEDPVIGRLILGS